MIAEFDIAFLLDEYIHIKQHKVYRSLYYYYDKFLHIYDRQRMPVFSWESPFSWKIIINQDKHVVAHKNQLLELAKIVFINRTAMDKNEEVPKLLVKCNIVEKIHTPPNEFKRMMNSIDNQYTPKSRCKDTIKKRLYKENKK